MASCARCSAILCQNASQLSELMSCLISELMITCAGVACEQDIETTEGVDTLGVSRPMETEALDFAVVASLLLSGTRAAFVQ